MTIAVPSGLNKGELAFEISADEELSENAIYKKSVEKFGADIILEKLDRDSVRVMNSSAQTAIDVHVNVYNKSIDDKLIKAYSVGNLEPGAEAVLNVSECYDMAELDEETRERMLYCEATQSDREFNIGDNMVILCKIAEANSDVENPQETQKPGQPNTPSATKKPSSATPTKSPASATPAKRPSSTTKTKGKSTKTATKKTSMPNKVTGVIIKAKKGRKIDVQWDIIYKVSGYQIQYAQNKKFTKKKKTKSVAGWTKSHKMMKGLKKGKRYYVRVRAYKKSSGKKMYGKWSKVKKIKIKK